MPFSLAVNSNIYERCVNLKKLIIQIPCFNEEESLPITLGDLPRKIEGVEVVEWLIIDDGSSDKTVEIAKKHGVDHIVRHIHNLGLARAFMTGIDACLRLGADIIVNTDGDNQYFGGDIPKLIQPILNQSAEIVVGERPISTIEHFSVTKKYLEKIGSWFVRKVSRTNIPDAPSGFRAFSRDAAMHIRVFNEYTYTLETIIQAGQKNMAITSVPVRTNKILRKSRLFGSIWGYIKKTVPIILRIFMTYQPFTFFVTPGVFLSAFGFLLGARFIYFLAIGQGSGHIQSLILSAVLMILGGLLILVGLLADLISVNRKMLEQIDYRIQKLSDFEKMKKE